MAEITVNTTREDDDGFHFEVHVSEAGSTSRHEVTLSRDDFDQLGKNAASPEDFVRGCFEFLLDREAKESILARFDIRDIGRYFPEFNDTFRA